VTNPADDVDELIAGLKLLPLIDGADLEQPSAAYDAFELVLSAILRAALVEVAPADRRSNNGRAFRRFVTKRFPVGRGRGDTSYAGTLWLLRCDFVKEKRTSSGVALTHDNPWAHRQRASTGELIVDLQSLIADFREAVDDLGKRLRSSPQLRHETQSELTQRRVRTVAIAPPPTQACSNPRPRRRAQPAPHSRGRLRAKTRPGIGDRER
jgi:hypothetical protein